MREILEMSAEILNPRDIWRNGVHPGLCWLWIICTLINTVIALGGDFGIILRCAVFEIVLTVVVLIGCAFIED